MVARTRTAFRLRVPNRLKPGDIDLRPQTIHQIPALQRGVSLAGAKTVGDLVARVAKATGWELYADRRVAVLPVWISRGAGGQSAGAGDLLTALCWCVTGAWRRVGPDAGKAAYVLTDDVIGIGTRYARIREWEMVSEALASENNQKADERIKELGVADLIGYAPGDPLALPENLVRSFSWAVGYRPDRAVNEGWTPLSELPPLVQSKMQEVANASARQPNEESKLRTDTAQVEVGLRLSLLLPGDGEVSIEDVPAEESLNDVLRPAERKAPETAALPSVLSSSPVPEPSFDRASDTSPPKMLLLAARNPEEAGKAVRLAHSLAFRQLWLYVEAGDAGRATLVSAIAEGQAVKLPVFAVLSLLKPGVKVPGVEPDRNTLGEAAGAFARRIRETPISSVGYASGSLRTSFTPPSDWLRFDLPGFAAAHLRRLREIAAVPGLAGLALADTAGPGYYPFQGATEETDGLGGSGDFGYTPEMRLAFLRAEGYDPIDLSVSGNSRNYFSQVVELPFFPDPGLMLQYGPSYFAEEGINVEELPFAKWRLFRTDANTRFMAGLYTKLRTAYPKLPLYVADRGGDPFIGVQFWGSWDSPAGLPYRVKGTTPQGAITFADPGKTSRMVLLQELIHPDTAAEQYRYLFLPAPVARPGEIKVPERVVDIRALPFDRVEPFLQSSLPPASPKQ